MQEIMGSNPTQDFTFKTRFWKNKREKIGLNNVQLVAHAVRTLVSAYCTWQVFMGSNPTQDFTFKTRFLNN